MYNRKTVGPRIELSGAPATKSKVLLRYDEIKLHNWSENPPVSLWRRTLHKAFYVCCDTAPEASVMLKALDNVMRSIANVKIHIGYQKTNFPDLTRTIASWTSLECWTWFSSPAIATAANGFHGHTDVFVST